MEYIKKEDRIHTQTNAMIHYVYTNKAREDGQSESAEYKLVPLVSLKMRSISFTFQKLSRRVVK